MSEVTLVYLNEASHGNAVVMLRAESPQNRFASFFPRVTECYLD